MEKQEKVKEKMRVCVIGAGAAGLCAVRHLAADLKFFDILAFEQNDSIGGTWVYTDEFDADYNNIFVHSSMYQSLRTNLPGELMNFPDFRKMQFSEKDSENSILTHTEILKYLNDYADEFKLKQFFQFNTKVEKVSQTANSIFDVVVKNIKTGKMGYFSCDAVMVCNGHYSKPYIPNIPGIETFPGKIIHSHSYRKPDDFAGKTVIILGGSYSGIDISKELSTCASYVYLSHNKAKLTGKRPAKLAEVLGIELVEGNTFHLKDGTSVSADTLIFCTGYTYTFPFLDKNIGISVQEKCLTPLYKHLININQPKVGFIGIPVTVIPFPLFHMQVQFFLKTLRGDITLPSVETMLKDSRIKDKSKKNAHQLGLDQFQYNDDLASMGKFPPLSSYYKMGYLSWVKEREKNIWNFKKVKFLLSSDEKNALVIPLET